MSFLKFGLTGAILLGLGACASPQWDTDEAATPLPPVTLENPEAFNDQDSETCLAANGTYEKTGRAGLYRCTLSYSDGGSVCTDNKECLGLCLAAETDGLATANADKPQTGMCQETNNSFGCHADIVDGAVQAILCKD